MRNEKPFFPGETLIKRFFVLSVKNAKVSLPIFLRLDGILEFQRSDLHLDEGFISSPNNQRSSRSLIPAKVNMLAVSLISHYSVFDSGSKHSQQESYYYKYADKTNN
jgi:hypothetical protein